MKDYPPELKEKLGKRLRRIEGQVRGVEKMIAEDRGCLEVMQQLVAIRSAVQGAAQTFMQDYVSECMTDLENQDRASRQKMMDNLVNLFSKVP